MKTEITKERLQEYFSPTENFEHNGVVTDYAEIEIRPDGIKKLEDNLDRCTNRNRWTDEMLERLKDVSNDAYEHIVCYVHFDAGTDTFRKLFIEVITAIDSNSLEADNLLTAEEQSLLIEAGLESLHNWRAKKQDDKQLISVIKVEDGIIHITPEMVSWIVTPDGNYQFMNGKLVEVPDPAPDPVVFKGKEGDIKEVSL